MVELGDIPITNFKMKSPLRTKISELKNQIWFLPHINLSKSKAFATYKLQNDVYIPTGMESYPFENFSKFFTSLQFTQK